MPKVDNFKKKGVDERIGEVTCISMKSSFYSAFES